jgi:hypothetical protein
MLYERVNDNENICQQILRSQIEPGEVITACIKCGGEDIAIDDEDNDGTWISICSNCGEMSGWIQTSPGSDDDDDDDDDDEN